MPSSVELAKEKLRETLAAGGPRLVDRSELKRLWVRGRSEWGLEESVGILKLLKFLVAECGLVELKLESDHYPPVKRYVWGDLSPYAVALSLKRGGYLSHGSAVFLHELTDQIPKTIYVNVEQRPKPRPKIGLSQARIDFAFGQRQRLSNLNYRFAGHTVVLLAGKNTGRLGVVDLELPGAGKVPATGLERTLIDIVVRPAYAGGLVQVLEAYRAARGLVSATRLKNTLLKLEYMYPYHQAIGFLMERAGYPAGSLRPLREMGVHHKFYLGYALREKEYDEGWRLFYPKGF